MHTLPAVQSQIMRRRGNAKEKLICCPCQGLHADTRRARPNVVRQPVHVPFVASHAGKERTEKSDCFSRKENRSYLQRRSGSKIPALPSLRERKRSAAAFNPKVFDGKVSGAVLRPPPCESGEMSVGPISHDFGKPSLPGKGRT